MAKAFFDTSILVYQLDRREPRKQEISRDLLRRYTSEGGAVISTQVLQEFYVAVTGKLGVDPLLVKSILRTFGNMELVTVGPDLIQEAIDISIQNRLSFWDALIVVCAESARCERLFTEDLNAGQLVGTVRIENPFLE